MHLRRNPQGSSRLFSAKTAQKDVLSKARHSNSWAGKQETDKVYLPINRPGKTPIGFFYLKKGSLISEGILTLVPLPKKGAKSCPTNGILFEFSAQGRDLAMGPKSE